MSQFTRFDAKLNIQPDPIASEQLGGNYWRVMKSFRFYLNPCSGCNEWTVYDKSRWVFVPAGFLTDGFSVPGIFQNIVSPWSQYAQAAVLHDYLCEYLSTTHDGKPVLIDRPEADKIFKDAMVAMGMDKEEAHGIYIAVSLYRRTWDIEAPSNSFKKRTLEAAFNFEGV